MKNPELKEKALPKATYVLLDYESTPLRTWVMVQYEGEDFLGVILSKFHGRCRVQCLEKPYGVRVAQEFEKEIDAVFYDAVYEAPITPWPTELDDEGNRTRKNYYKY